MTIRELRELMESLLDRGPSPKKTAGQGQGPGGSAAPVNFTVNFVGAQAPEGKPVLDLPLATAVDDLEF